MLLPLQILEPLLRRLQLAGQRRHPVAMCAGVVLAVGQRITGCGERFGGAVLGALGGFRRSLRFTNPRLRRLGFAPGCLRSGGRIAPAGEHQPGLGQLDPVGQDLVAFCRAGLPPQRRYLGIEPGHDVLQPGEVDLGCAQLLFGVLAADVQPGNACCLFKHHPPFGRLGRDDRSDPALADQRRRVRPGSRIGKDQRDILGAHIAPVDPVSAACPAFDPANDFQFLGLGIFGHQYHFGKVARRALGGASENHVFHAAAAHRFGRALAHHPADRFEQVGFTTAVGSDHPGQSGFDAQLGRLNEAFEATELEPLDAHGARFPVV